MTGLHTVVITPFSTMIQMVEMMFKSTRPTKSPIVMSAKGFVTLPVAHATRADINATCSYISTSAMNTTWTPTSVRRSMQTPSSSALGRVVVADLYLKPLSSTTVNQVLVALG